MIVVNADLDDEVLGTSNGDTLTATAWRGGKVVADGLDVVAASMSWDATGDQVAQGRLSLTIADPDGTLSPWGMGDALAPGGSRIQLTWVSGSSGFTVPRGRWRIRSAKPAETWRIYRGVPLKVPGGGSVSLSLEEDVTATAALCRIDGDAPVAGATALVEMRRLLSEIGAVDATLSPADVTIPTSYVAWPESRLDAVGDLLDMLAARSRVGGDGSLQVIPKAGVSTSWVIQGGESGALISSDRELNDTGVYNAVRSSNAVSDGSLPLVGRSYLSTGALAYGGPFGKVPVFHQAVATTQAGVDADAATFLASMTSAGTIDLAVTCLAHPALQVHDIVTLLAPTLVGDQALTGRVVGMTWGMATGVLSKQMKLTVRVSADVLEAIAQKAISDIYVTSAPGSGYRIHAF